MILGFDDTEFVAGSLLIFMAVISLVCTVLTLYLIVDMKRRNGYLLLIFNVTVCQLLYDITFFLIPFYKVDIVMECVVLISTFSGLGVALWTNVISIILYNIVEYLHSFDIYGSYIMFASVIFIPSAIIAICATAFYLKNPEWTIFNDIYYWIRIASILFNIGIHLMISYKLSNMGFKGAHGSPVKGQLDDPQQDPVKILASRIKYYPIIQIISRSGAAWYELQYGYGTDSYGHNESATHAVSLFMYAICVPSAGIGYFLVFLIVQPAAYNHLMERWQQWTKYCCCCCCWLSRRDTNRPDTLSTSTGGDYYQQQRSLLGRMEEMDEDELSTQVDAIYGSPHETNNIRSIYHSVDRSDDGYSLADSGTL